MGQVDADLNTFEDCRLPQDILLLAFSVIYIPRAAGARATGWVALFRTSWTID